MDQLPLYQAIAKTADWVERLQNTSLKDVKLNWLAIAETRLEHYVNMLPSGSGIDCGSKIVDASKSKIVIQADYHHMDEHGCYCGWSHHTIVVTPSLIDGFEIKVTGRNRNEIKDYLAETYDYVLSQLVDPHPENLLKGVTSDSAN